MVTNEKTAEKAILSLRVAQTLMAKGYNLIRLENSRRYRGKIAFIFEYNDELEQEMAKFRRMVTDSDE